MVEEMKREIIEFTTEEAWLTNRKQDLTSTDIADLFGCGYSNYDELFNFTTRGFLSNQRTYGIKTSGITIPLDNSSNNVFASIDPVIPGFDRIRHFIYVDDRITRPKLPSTLFSIQ